MQFTAKKDDSGKRSWTGKEGAMELSLTEISDERATALAISIYDEENLEQHGGYEIIKVNQEDALELARLLKEFGVRGVLPEPPAPEPVAEPQEPQLPMATTQE
jgi:hypothetical protein